MKTEYPRYGKRARSLEHNLTENDKILLDRFLAYCAIGAGTGQLSKHRRNLLYFRDIVEKPLNQITKDDAILFWGLVKNAPYEEHTKVAVRKSVKRFLKWHYRDLEMLEPLKIPKYYVNKKRVNKTALIRPHELRTMLRAAEKIRDKAILMLLYETAARPQEIRDLQWQHIIWDENEVHLYSRKTTDCRELPIREALDHLRRWKEEWVFEDPKYNDFVFPATIEGKLVRSTPISVVYINRTIKRLAKKAGIERNVYSYLLRHTRYTQVKKCGVSGKQLRQFAGHSPGSNQEEVYNHLTNEDMKNEVIEKVYSLQEIPKPEREQFQARIQKLEQQNQILVDKLANIEKALPIIDKLTIEIEKQANTVFASKENNSPCEANHYGN